MGKCFLCKRRISMWDPPIMAYVKKGKHRKKGGKLVYVRICVDCKDDPQVDHLKASKKEKGEEI